MDSRILRHFLAIAKFGKITVAADALHVTQPTLSRQLAALEEEVGCPLVIRGGHRLLLTEAGRRFKKRAEEILEMIDKAQMEARQPGISGDIYIGSGETPGLGIIANEMRGMRAIYQDIRFHIFSGDGDEIGERLNSGLLDFGIFIEPAKVDNYEAIELPYIDRWGALTLRNSGLAEKEFIRPENLWDEPLIISKQKYMEDHITRWIKRDYSRLHIIGTYNLLYNASIMVKHHLGHALGLENLINICNDSELCFRQFEPQLTVKVYFVWKPSQVFSPAAEMFLKRISEKYG